MDLHCKTGNNGVTVQIAKKTKTKKKKKTFFLFDEERKDQYTTISEPSSARQRNAI